MTLDEVVEKIEGVIKEHGFAVQPVMGGPADGGGFCYTIGLTKHLNHPEVYMVGFDPKLCATLLRDVGDLIKDGYDFRNPTLCDRVIKDYNVAFRPVEAESVAEHGGIGLVVLGGEFEAVQMFLPDRDGKFPWDEGCHPEYAYRQTALLKTTGPIPGSEEHKRGLN